MGTPRITSHEKIAILDYGSQYTHLIARRVRELNVYSEILPSSTKAEGLKEMKGIILSGGPNSVYEQGSPQIDKEIFALGIPILGLCYGHQLIAHYLGGKVSPGTLKEYGIAIIDIKDKKGLFKTLEDREKVWMSHGDHVSKLPDGFILSAISGDGIVSAMSDYQRKIFGLQFHPEVTHSEHGMKILENFIVNICSCEQDWNVENYLEELMLQIKEKVGTKKVFLLVSGGVDSSVVFALLNKSIGKERVYGLHVDTGFMRKDESSKIREFLTEQGFDNFHVVDASSEFLSALKGVYDPEEKRNIIGNVFIEVQQNVVKEMHLNKENWLLAQGTIYPDTIESQGTEHADLIKTHHNRVEIIQKMIEQGEVIEPISSLYKDEVRELGKELGLPDFMINRHPFPGPGLAIRCLCSDGNVKDFDKETIEKRLKELASPLGVNAYALPVKSVGVQGDHRSYKHPGCITGNISWDKLQTLSTAITNKIFSDINRVLYLIKPKDFREMEISKSYLVKERLDLLRDMDDEVAKIIKKHGLQHDIWQFPVVLIPLGHKHKESVVLRPISSREAMTASFFHMPKKVLDELSDALSRYPIDYIFYDITNKPPATIEWE